MPLQQFDETTPLNLARNFVAADGITNHDILVSVKERYRIDTVTLTNSDTIDHAVRLQLVTGIGDPVELGSVIATAGVGYAGIPGQLYTPFNFNQPDHLIVPPGSTLRGRLEVAATGALGVVVSIFGGEV
jgi:hypothetical protein